MKREAINSVNSKVYRQFPEVKGKSPKVSLQNSKTGNPGSPKTYLMVYSGTKITSDNKSIRRIVRVVANEKGKILKISTSR